MRRSTVGLATMLALAGVANAGENVVSKVTAHAEGGKTVIVVHGSATPSFTAYRLEKPARIVVDVADGKWSAAELGAGPVDVDTWAVNQMAAAQYSDDASRTARLMIGFKRPSTYDVKATGHDLVITVTPDEPMPAAAAVAPAATPAQVQASSAALAADAAKLEEARKKRVEAEAQVAATEQRRARAVEAEHDAQSRAGDADREAQAAKARAQAAKDELERVIAARKLEEQRLADVQKRTSTATAQSEAAHKEALAVQSDRARTAGDLQAEQARLARLRAEAVTLQRERELESKKLAETQAAARKAIVERQAHLAEVEQAARARQAESEAARAAEQRRADARAEEAARLAQAATAAERARTSENASREADKRANDALTRAHEAENAARSEALRLQSIKREAAAQAAETAAAQAKLAAARAELAKLTAAQETERARVDEARREAARVAAERAQAAERAEHAAALASGSLERMQQAEREARKIADERARESARLEQARRESAAVAATRAQELAKLEIARGEAARVEAARRAEEARLAQLKGEVLKQSDELKRQAELTRVAGDETRRQQEAARLASDEAKRQSEAAARASDEARRQSEAAARAGDEAKKQSEMAARAGAEARRQSEAARTAGSEAQRQKDENRKLNEAARLASVEAKRQQEAARLAGDEAQKQQEAARAAADEAQRLKDEAKRQQEAARAASDEAARARSELAQLTAAQAAERARLQSAQKDAARAAKQLAEVDAARIAAEKRAKAQAASAEASSAAASAETRARLEREQSDLLKQLAAERAQLAKKLETAQAEVARVSSEQQRKQAERAQLDEQLKAARAELARIEQATRERLAMVPTPAKVAAAQKPVVAARNSKDALPVDKVAARVRDVRFSDDADSERVILELLGNSEATVVRADEHGAVLKIARADLPKKLERTLDASALKGPIRSVSTYADVEDPGAVRVEVALAEGGPHAAPTLVRDGGTLTWEFPRSGTRSLAPAKVAAYGVTLPLQVAAASPAPTRPNVRQRKTFSGRRIDLDFKDADIGNILKLISDVGQVNIVAADDVKGTITIKLRDVPWDQALDVILRAKGLGMQREGNLIRVAPLAVLEKELEQQVARSKAAVELKPLDTRLIALSYADGTQILPRIQEVMSSRGHVSVDARTNQLIVTDVAANISLAEDLVRNLDTQTPQVLIEARIVEANTTFERDIGIQWGGNTINSTATGNPTGIVFPSTVGLGGGATDTATAVQGLQGAGAASPNFAVNMPAAVGTGSGGALGLTLGSVNGNYNINLRLSALENTGWVRIVSSPKIMTLDNIEATIEQGTSIPVSVVSAAGANTMFVDAKLNLTVKPHVTNEGSILMTVLITRNEPDFVNTAANGTPTIQKKQAHSQMLVRDGDTAVIGGIYTRNSGLSYTKVPWFAEIPVLGWLFKARKENDNRTELLIFITPRIINRSVVAR